MGASIFGSNAVNAFRADGDERDLVTRFNQVCLDGVLDGLRVIDGASSADKQVSHGLVGLLCERHYTTIGGLNHGQDGRFS